MQYKRKKSYHKFSSILNKGLQEPSHLIRSIWKKDLAAGQLFLYFSKLFHIYTKSVQLIIWPEGWKNIPHRGGGGKCLSER